MNATRPIHEEQSYRDSLRAAVLHASQCLTAGSIDDTVPEILATTGKSLHVDRVLVLENHSPGEDLPLALCYVWQVESVPQVSAAFFSEYPSKSAGVGQWLLPLQEGKHVRANFRNATGAVGDLLRKLDMKSILIVPIMIAGSAWGSLGVDSCRLEREWTSVEIELLEILANLIGTTIIRDRYIKLLRNSEERFRTVAEAAQDAMIVINSRGLVHFWNSAAQRILGYAPCEAAGKNVHEWLAPARYRNFAAGRLCDFAANGTGDVIGKTEELSAIRKDGVEIPIELSVAGMQVDGEWFAVGILRDISARKKTEQRIAWLARNDVLTGLPSRSVFVEELQQAILLDPRGERHFAVFYLDLDRFKDVNDTLGHPVGDLLLKGVAERLKTSLRDNDKIARFGGDEFAILATELSDPTDAGIVAGKLLAALALPFHIDGNEVHSGATIGISTREGGDEDAEELLAHAEVALNHAKSEGRGTFRVFTDDMDKEVHRRVTLLAELRDAIQREELFLVYQPQVNMETRAIVGLEALIRWRHPKRGLVSPDQFIPAAENSGLIISLGQWVLWEACRQMRCWLNMGIDVPLIAVNVSPTQFKAPSDFSAEIAAALVETGISPEMLEIELTETALMRASRHNGAVLQSLRDQGIRIAIDDFGTGYSSLDYLRRFPATRIKIAQTFVEDIASNAGSAAITRAAISLGRELGLSVIAEGVETEEQVTLLTQWGCEEAQGYHFAKPLSIQDATTLLRLGSVPKS